MCLAVPGRIESIDSIQSIQSIQESEGPLALTARVSIGGIVKQVNLAYVPEGKVGDYVLVHVGFALTIIDGEEAKRTLGYFEEIAAIEESKEPRT